MPGNLDQDSNPINRPALKTGTMAFQGNSSGIRTVHLSIGEFTAMKTKAAPDCIQENRWHYAQSMRELRQNTVAMVRIDGKQVALFHSSQGVLACNNRCPHEGYPLSEGNLSDGCILTCNWHNWKFDLNTGRNLFGGDRLRTYPVELRGDEIWVDLGDPPYQQQYIHILDSLRDAFDDHSYDRISREIARLLRLSSDPFDVLRCAIDWSWQRMEFGWTHAYAGMADWLALYDETAGDQELALVCLTESVGHASFDVLRESEYPFTQNVTSFSESGFAQAIEREDENAAVAMIRGGLKDGLVFSDFEQSLTRAALAHYNDFGHSLIYVTKAGYLIERLGEAVTEPLLLSLIREFVYASREDRIPEFRRYREALEKWGDGKSGNSIPKAEQWDGCGIKSALDATVNCSDAPPELIYPALLEANAMNMLRFDIKQQDKTRVTVSGNVGWLDFTHGLTFSNAVRKQCTRFPRFWPQGLLQMACFVGRNSAFTTTAHDLSRWNFDDNRRGIGALVDRLFDHGQDEYIVSVHLLKTALAVREEAAILPPGQATILGAALNRFFNSPLKRKQAKRTAYQSLQFVSKE